jgi:hypothetical protein
LFVFAAEKLSTEGWVDSHNVLIAMALDPPELALSQMMGSSVMAGLPTPSSLEEIEVRGVQFALRSPVHAPMLSRVAVDMERQKYLTLLPQMFAADIHRVRAQLFPLFQSPVDIHTM